LPNATFHSTGSATSSRVAPRADLVDRPSLSGLAGVGPSTAAKFAELGITTPEQLLAYLPRLYRDWRVPQAIATLTEGEAIAVGRVVRVKERAGRFPLVTVDLADETGTIAAKWFGRKHLFGRFSAGDRLFVSGRVTRAGLLAEMNVTNHKELRAGEPYVGEIVPVYGATKELASRTIRATIAKNLDRLVRDRIDALPADLVAQYGFPSLREAWYGVHAPRDMSDVERGRSRIVFEEFFGIALAAALKRALREAAGGAVAIDPPESWYRDFVTQLPFAPTGAQTRVIEQIARDMTRTAPMNRLLQGDVGSGKTLVAAAAVVLAHLGGVQSALMAPTEIVAAQHAAKLAPLLLPFGITVEAVFGSQGARERRAAVERIASGQASLAVGTHALLTESVEFARLGLVVIDEQHRFGVRQRALLRAKSTAPPHTLYMTATPIPRTLAQTKYADLDVSIIDELPPGRTPIATYVIRESRKAAVYDFVRKNVEMGQQAYVVAPAIDAGETALTSATGEAEYIARDVFPDLKVAVLHGRMPPKEKDAVMAGFKRGEIDVLVATTVVEVGVDVPNASVMVILDADRYGLATLHQLRGRVGRGAAVSSCILMTSDDRESIERLDVLAQTNDGFEIAEADLRLRKAGQLAGTSQAGEPMGTIGDIIGDFALYMKAKGAAEAIVSVDPELVAPENAALRGLIDDVAAARALLVTA
jgi:ATP-dependent DNA helicase RecG